MVRLATDYLDEIAVKFPEKKAFADDRKNITFGELKESAERIATSLLTQGVFRKPVVIYMDKSVECIVAFLGVAYSGNFYTPIDTKMPEVRVNKIIDILEPEVIITDLAHKEQWKKLNTHKKINIYEEMMLLQADEESIRKQQSRLIDNDVLYVFFTSGSTGIPKGVTISHKSVIDYTEWVAGTFEVDDKTVFGNQAPLYFDNSILDIYQTIKNGATTYLIPENLFMFPVNLLKYMEECKINFIFWVPSALCLVANLKAVPKYHVSSLKKILFCGEVMPNKQLNIWRREYPDVLFANLYGPTEITDVCAYYVVNRNFADDEPLPIGRPCLNTDIIVLDEENKLVEGDNKGELCVRGISLSQGYYNNPNKTVTAFVQNPLNTAYPEIIYRTGDLVHYDINGDLIYDGRKDFQIKHMGHRIELGEIETAVSSLETIEYCACIYDDKQGKIVLFYTGQIEETYIIDQLKKIIPEYMIPNSWIKLEIMPMNFNGKIDRVKLKKYLTK